MNTSSFKTKLQKITKKSLTVDPLKKLNVSWRIFIEEVYAEVKKECEATANRGGSSADLNVYIILTKLYPELKEENKIWSISRLVGAELVERLQREGLEASSTGWGDSLTVKW